MSQKKLVGLTALVASLLLACLAFSHAQEGDFEAGVIPPPGPPFDIFLEVTPGPNGEPILSTDEFHLAQGGYYRFNFVCPEVEGFADGFHFEAPELVANSHIRVFSVGQVELYLQGQTFRAIQCDAPGTGRFSFHPMRTGVYELYVRDMADPPQEAFGRFVVE